MEASLPVSSASIQAPRFGAGFGLRAGAQIIDLIMHNAIGFLTNFTAGIVIGLYTLATGTSSAAVVTKLQATTPLGIILALIGYVAYHAISEGLYGATLGKLIFRIHVLREDGHPAGMGAALIRSIAFNIDALFFGLIAMASMRSSDLQQRFGDKWAKTVVVERSKFNQYPWPSGWRFVLIFLMALIADGLLYSFALIFKLL